jgi:dipeptide transport system substrate-binding protein
MQADLARVGIKVELVTYDWPTYLNRVKRGEHDMAQLGWSGDNGDPDNFLYTLFSCDAVTRGSNNARYCNADFNRLIADARATSDVRARSDLYARALAMLADDEPVVPLVHSTVFRLMSTRVAGYVMNPFDVDYFADLTLKDF